MEDMSIDTFMQYAMLAGVPENVARDVFNAALSSNYIAEGVDPGDILDLMTVNKNAPESYTNFITNFKEIKTKRPEITTIAVNQNLFAKISDVSAGVGGGFENTQELKVMTYSEAINGPDGERWKAEVDN
jgi:hypothetical protein